MAGLIKGVEVKRRVAEEVEGGMRKKMEEGGKDKAVRADEEEVVLVEVEVEPKTGFTFPAKLVDGKQLNAVGLRKKKLIALNVNIYAFGIYADNGKVKELLKTKFSEPPPRPTQELYDAVINSGVEMTVRMVIVFGGLSMSLVRKNMGEGIGGSVKKLNGGRRDDELVNKMMANTKDSMKLSSGSVFEITRLPGNFLQTKVKEEIISKVESELLCRAYFHMYLGNEPFDKEAKERFGQKLLSLL